MLFTRNAYYFRKFYKEEKARENSRINLDFIGSLPPNNKHGDAGFSKLIYGNRENIGKLLASIALNVAADDQAIYELIQNADDSKSSIFSVSYNEKYLLCINNGNYFSDEDMSAIINVADNYKDGEDIGSFGIGFKILHRLVGTDDGREAIINDYAGPIIFSWNELLQLKKFIEGEQISVSGIGNAKENYEYKRDKENPWLVKILYTCFPSHYGELILLGDYETKETRFSQEELAEMREFLRDSLQNINLTEDNNLENGSIFFLRLGQGKSKFLDEGIDKIKSGLAYSFKFLNSLQKIFINGEEIKIKDVSVFSHSFPIGSDEFKYINPKNKNRDIKFTFAFYSDYKEASDLQNELAPNLYTFFSMDEEKNGFSFLLHCNAFDMNNDRRKLQANSQINEKLLPEIANKIIKYSDIQKENNRNLFLSLYSNFLLSRHPKNKPHLNNSFSKHIRKYISENIPTKNGFSDNADNVKINKLNPKLNLDLANFGLTHIQWFEWDNQADKLLMDEAKDKLGIQEWDIRDIIENADIESVNAWIATCDEKTYKAFVKDLDNSALRKETREIIFQIKLFKFSDGQFYSFNDIISVGKSEKGIYSCYVLPSAIFKTPKTESIYDELSELGILLSEINTSEYPKIFSPKMPDEKKIFDLIAKKCKTNILSARGKKKLFLNFVNEETKFDNVAEDNLKNLELFCDNNSAIKPLNKLIGNIKTPSWLNTYKIKQEEYFPKLDPYLISGWADIFKEIYQPNIDKIIAGLTTAEDIKSLIKLYKDNQKSFFKELIIRKKNNEFVIDKKTYATHQVQSADKETRKFLYENCADNLFVLPDEFVGYKDEEGIIKADDLHSLILEFVDVDEHKEILVDIIKYKAKLIFLQKLSEFRFNSETKYSKEHYEYKILHLACNELKENDYQQFRDKVVIRTENRDLKLLDIPTIKDTIKIEKCEISLAQILPDSYENSDHLSSLINQFIDLGLDKERIENLFGISEEPELSDIFQMFSAKVEVLENAEQLAFAILYNKYIEKIELTNFKVLCMGGGKYDLYYSFYTNQFNFLLDDATLDSKYKGIEKILKKLPFQISDENQLLEEPYVLEDEENDEVKFVCPDLIPKNVTDEQKLSFIDFLFNLWYNKSKKKAIKKINWSKIGDLETKSILGFNPITSVYPSEYACESEVLPEYFIEWLNKEETKINFISDLGVWTDNSVIVELRKYLSGKINNFPSNRLGQEARFNEDQVNLFNSFVWLKAKEITLETPEQFATFEEVIKVINQNRINTNELEFNVHLNYDELDEHATEWDESYYKNWKQDSGVSIFLYEGEIPNTISLNEIEDYVFYYFNDGNSSIDEDNNIYINKNVDIYKELEKLELDYEDLDFKGFWQNKLEVLKVVEKEKSELKNKIKELEKEKSELKNKIEELEKEKKQLISQNTSLGNSDATLGGEISTDISKIDQEEANREAKEIVKKRLESEGFKFTKEIGTFSTINGVFKDDIEYPLVVKSYKNQDKPLKIGANEWIHLMKPNSMLWLYFGNNNITYLKMHELFRNQDKLTISFSTVNIDIYERLYKFAELLRYFKEVHIDFKNVKPKNYSVAKDLSEYCFDKRRNEEDISGDDEGLLS